MIIKLILTLSNSEKYVTIYQVKFRFKIHINKTKQSIENPPKNVVFLFMTKNKNERLRIKSDDGRE